MTEPVVGAAGLGAIINAGLMWARLMGWIDWSDEQFNSFMVFMNLMIPIGLGIWARSQSTSLSQPRDTDGATLSRAGDVPANKELATLQEQAIEINESGAHP
jgi:hypothetical protein